MVGEELTLAAWSRHRGETAALVEQSDPTIGFSVPSARGGFVWAISAELPSDGRDVRHALHLIKVIGFHWLEMPSQRWPPVACMQTTQPPAC